MRFLVALLASLAILSAAAESVTFDLKWTSTDNESIELFIQSDLPDEAEVRVTVRRIYTRIGDPPGVTYSIPHFREDGTLEQWREPRRVPADPEVWKAELLSHQAEMGRIGAAWAFEIADIDSDIELTAYAFANKTVVARSEIEVRLPLITAEPIHKRSTLVGFDNLAYGEVYRLLGDRTPLMPKLQAETWADLEYTPLPAGTLIRVEAITRRSGDFWYQVSLPEHPGYVGWINSIALMRTGVEWATALD
ncbi:MAG: hypothetical protein OXC09_00515 [Truepera sp.]|nr:hypothetical protein [Truepera sp.]